MNSKELTLNKTDFFYKGGDVMACKSKGKSKSKSKGKGGCKGK